MDKIAMYKEEIFKTASQKRDDAKREKDTETRVWRDRVKPEAVRSIKSMPRAIGGAIGGSLAGSVLTGGNPKASQIAGTIGAVAGGYSKRRKLESAELDRLSNKHFGKGATKEQHDTVKKKTMASTAIGAIPGVGQVGGLMSFSRTPESVIQKARREKKSNK